MKKASQVGHLPPPLILLILCWQTMEYIILNKVYTLKIKKIQQIQWGGGVPQSSSLLIWQIYWIMIVLKCEIKQKVSLENIKPNLVLLVLNYS